MPKIALLMRRDVMYYIMDGRANFDIDKAMVLEVVEHTREEKVKEWYMSDYADTDAVLVDSNFNIVLSSVEQ